MRFILLVVLVPVLSVLSFSQSVGSLTGRVVRDGQPVPGARVSITFQDPSGNKAVNAIAGADGIYRFDRLKPGRHMITAEGEPGKGIYSGSIEILAGAAATLDMPLTMQGYEGFGSQQRISETVTVAADASQPVDEISKAVNVISGQEMRDRADITLVDSVRTIPGFRVQQLGGFGRTASIKSRGLRNQDTAILLDGVRFRDASSITGDATAFLSDITLTSISRVEVLRGPGSSLYGTNAVGGTIDIVTPVPASGWHGQISGAGGGLGMGRFRGNISKGTDDGRFGFNAAVSRTVFAKGIDGNDDANNTNFQSRFEATPSEKTNLSARFFFSDAFVALNSNPDTAGIPPVTNLGVINAVPGSNFVFDADDPDADQRSRSFNAQVAGTHAFSNKLSLQGYYSGLRTKRTNNNGILGAGFQSASTSVFEATIHTANAHIDWTPNAYHRLTAGYEFENEGFRNEGSTPSGTEDFFTSAAQRSSTIYTQELLRLQDGRLQFAAGFRAQYYGLQRPVFSDNNPPYANLKLDDPPAAYTFDGSASYYLSSSGTKFRVHAGNGYRVPSLYERFGTFFNTFPTNSFVALGDPFLKPERTAALDAGMDQHLFDQKMTVSGTFFYTKLVDIIGFGNAAPAIGSTPRLFGGYENQKGGIARGLELSGDVKPTKSTSVFASYTLTNSDQITPQVSGSGVFRTLGVPTHQLTLNVTQRIRKFWINADALATSSYLAPIFSNFSFNTYVYRFDGNRRVDLTAGYTFTFDKAKFNLRVFGTIENLFDNEYFENGFRTPGRTVRAGVSFGF